jgi:hypothetical protein
MSSALERAKNAEAAARLRLLRAKAARLLQQGGELAALKAASLFAEADCLSARSSRASRSDR